MRAPGESPPDAMTGAGVDFQADGKCVCENPAQFRTGRGWYGQGRHRPTAGDEAGEGLTLKELACHAGSRAVEGFYFGVTGS